MSGYESPTPEDEAVDPEMKMILLGAVALEPDSRTSTVEAFSTDLATYLDQIWPGR